MKTWTKVALGTLTGIVGSQIIRSRKVNISYAAQLVEDSLTLASGILPGQNSNYDRLYTVAYNRNELPLELTWTKRSMGFDYFEDFTDTFIIQKDQQNLSSPADEKVVFYLSGGGFWLEPTLFHFNMARKLANLTNRQVVMPIFPKGPTHNVVDAHKMILKRYMYLIEEKGIAPENITILGDSTGGALAVSFMQQLRDYDLPMPASAVLIAPILDGTLQNFLVAYDNVEYEPFLQPKLITLETETFAKPLAAINPLVSPWYGSFKDLPPMLVVSGTRDMTLTYTIALRDKAEAEGLPIYFDIHPHMVHIFPIYPIPEAHDALVNMAEFIEKEPF
ncbi:alpha/beta hydrolase [Aerococcaceae bacterium 50-4]